VGKETPPVWNQTKPRCPAFSVESEHAGASPVPANEREKDGAKEEGEAAKEEAESFGEGLGGIRGGAETQESRQEPVVELGSTGSEAKRRGIGSAEQTKEQLLLLLLLLLPASSFHGYTSL
jgi:hypothetical protein